MSDSGQAWFKLWAKEALASADLQSLTDHEERVWWRLMMVASTQTPRWSVLMPAEALARMCASTVPRLRAALGRLGALGMVIEDAGRVTIVNWQRYQETPDAARKRLVRAQENGGLSADKERTKSGQTADIGPGMSAKSKGDCPENVRTEERGERKEDRSISSSEEIARRRAPPSKLAKTISEAFRERMREEYPDLDEPWQYDQATNHTAYLKALDKERYYANWLRRSREFAAGRSMQNGRANGAQRTAGGSEYALVSEYPGGDYPPEAYASDPDPGDGG